MNQLKKERQLINRILQGEVNAYTYLVETYKDMVFNLCIRIIGNRELAEETAQDVFVKAYQALDGFDGRSKFSTWLYKIAYHKSLDVVKSERRKQSLGLLEERGALQLRTDKTVWEEITRQERSLLLTSKLKELEEEDATVLMLYYLEELSLKEISSIISCSVNTVKVRLFRARKKLRILLEAGPEAQILREYGS